MRRLPQYKVGILRGLPAACLAVCLCGCDAPKRQVEPQATRKPPEQPAQVSNKGDESGETKLAGTGETSVAPEASGTNAAAATQRPAQAKRSDRVTVVDGQIASAGEDDIGVRPPSAEPDVEAERERMKLDVEDHIFALIRLEMERMLIERRDLLAAGRPPHDENIRRLEDSIMRAQNYLMEAGEDVEPPDPPIVESAPKQKSANQPATAPSTP